MTYTVATLEVPKYVFGTIANLLRRAGYDQAFGPDGSIDMTGIALTEQPPYLWPNVQDPKSTDTFTFIKADKVFIIPPDHPLRLAGCGAMEVVNAISGPPSFFGWWTEDPSDPFRFEFLRDTNQKS